MEDNKNYNEISEDTRVECDSESYVDEGGSCSESGDGKKKLSPKLIAIIAAAAIAIIVVAIALALFLVLGGNTDGGEAPDEETGDSDSKKEDTDTTTYEYEVNSDGKTCTITGLKGEKSDVTKIVIPSKIDKYRVTKIGHGAFKDNHSLVSVKISEGVTEIGISAFFGCYLIEEVDIPESVNILNSGAFADCYSLKDIKLPSSLKSLDLYVFDGCENLEFTTEDGLTYLQQNGNPYYALIDVYHGITEYKIKAQTVIVSSGLDTLGLERITVEEGNENYKSVDGNLYSKDGKTLHLYIDKTETGVFRIPDGVTVIGDEAFSNYLNISGVEIPDGVKEIGRNAFMGCDFLQSIEIPKSVTHIGTLAFNGCQYLKEIAVDPNNQNFKSIDGNLYTKDGETIICYALGKEEFAFEIPNGVKRIEDFAFYSSCFSEITIPKGVTSIGVYGFGYCRNLTDMVIPDTVKEIKMCAFSGCSKLTDIRLPSRLVKIGDYAFEDCGSLVELNIPGKVEKIGKIVSAEYSYLPVKINVDPSNKHYKSIDGTLYSKDGKRLIHYAPIEEVTHLELPAGVTVIEEYAFCYSDLESIVLPDNLKAIGDRAFSFNVHLSNIELPKNLKSIGQAAFVGCEFTNIVIPDSVTKIGNEAFYSCRKLESVLLPDSVESFGWGVFSYCSSLIEIILPEGVKTLSSSDFYFCSSLRYIYIPASVTNIDEGVFNKCDALTEIIVDSKNKNYKSIDGNLYSADGKTLIKCVSVPGESIFTVPDGVEVIADGAFQYNLHLVSVRLSVGLTEIGDNAFKGCKYLETVNIPTAVNGGITRIGEGAFSDCGSLVSIALPDSLVSMGEGAFSRCYSLTSIVIPKGVTSIGEGVFAECSALTNVYYKGSEEQWSKVEIGYSNNPLLYANFQYNYK